MLKRLLMSFAVAATVAISCVPDAAAETGYAPQTSNGRGIKITVIPQSIRNDAKTWDVEVTLETHTQSLNEDLAESSVLMADGKRYAPQSWEGAPPGGHHRKGLLHFNAIAPQPRSMELQIRLAGEASPRSFKWVLK